MTPDLRRWSASFIQHKGDSIKSGISRSSSWVETQLKKLLPMENS
jgi:hypothetical protein